MMPGPVSDSYDPEWGTAANRHEIEEALDKMHAWLGATIGSPPKHILEVLAMPRGKPLRHPEGSTRNFSLTERELRILRFACERAKDSL